MVWRGACKWHLAVALLNPGCCCRSRGPNLRLALVSDGLFWVRGGALAAFSMGVLADRLVVALESWPSLFPSLCLMFIGTQVSASETGFTPNGFVALGATGGSRSLPSSSVRRCRLTCWMRSVSVPNGLSWLMLLVMARCWCFVSCDGAGVWLG